LVQVIPAHRKAANRYRQLKRILLEILNMRIRHIILLFSIITLTAKSQDTSKYNVFLKIHPLAVINPDRPSIKGSVEFLYKHKIGIELGYGRRYSDRTIWYQKLPDTLTRHFQGETEFIEITLYNPLRDRPLLLTHKGQLDLSFGIIYRHFTDLRNFQIYYSHPNDSTSTLDCYAIKREVNIFALKAGVAHRTKKISYEFYVELGVRHRKQSFINREWGKGDYVQNFGSYFINHDYNGFLPSALYAFKINYLLFNSR
jgi:hypothetical protein